MTTIKNKSMLKRKRVKIKKSIRGLATEIGISHTYLADIENLKKTPTKKELLDKIAKAYQLTEEERLQFYDLFALINKDVPADLKELIVGKQAIVNELRRLKIADWGFAELMSGDGTIVKTVVYQPIAIEIKATEGGENNE